MLRRSIAITRTHMLRQRIWLGAAHERLVGGGQGSNARINLGREDPAEPGDLLQFDAHIRYSRTSHRTAQHVEAYIAHRCVEVAGSAQDDVAHGVSEHDALLGIHLSENNARATHTQSLVQQRARLAQMCVEVDVETKHR